MIESYVNRRTELSNIIQKSDRLGTGEVYDCKTKEILEMYIAKLEKSIIRY